LIEIKDSELPLEIKYKDKTYWLKKSTKEGKNGIYMNDQVPKREILVKESDTVNISTKL